MKTIWDYKVSTRYGCLKGYPLNYCKTVNGVRYGFHKGEDRAAPRGTPVTVNGIIIGTVGSTGYSTGDHTHIGKWKDGSSYNPSGGGAKFKNAVVTQIDNLDNDANGRYVRIQADGYSWVYLHLDTISNKLKVGQKLVFKPKPKYTIVKKGEGLSHIARRVGYKYWWNPTSWSRLSKLNGYGYNWIKFNSKLKPNQKIRIK